MAEPEVELQSGDNGNFAKDFNGRKKSPRWLYFGIQMFLSFAQNLGFQYLPIYNRKLGATETQMGLLTSVQNVFSTGLSPFFGRASDMIGRKLFLLIGGFVATTSTIVMAVAQTPNQVILAVGFNAFGLSILIPTWSGALADYTTGGKRGGFIGRLSGVAYGYVTIALVIYALVSPSLPYTEIEQYRLVIWISAANFAGLILASWILIDLRDPNRIKNTNSLFSPWKDKRFRRFLIVILSWWFFMSIAWSYFPIVIADVILATPAEVAWIGIFGAVAQSLASYRLADYVDRVGPKRSLFIGFLPFSLVPLLFAFATEWWHLIPAQIVGGIGIGFGFTALTTYILEMAGDDYAGNYTGSYNISWGVVTFVGSYFGGYFLQQYKVYTGSLTEALTMALLGVAFFRFLTNFLMYYFLPDIRQSKL